MARTKKVLFLLFCQRKFKIVIVPSCGPFFAPHRTSHGRLPHDLKDAAKRRKRDGSKASESERRTQEPLACNNGPVEADFHAVSNNGS